MPIMDGPESIMKINKLVESQIINPLIIITCTAYTDK